MLGGRIVSKSFTFPVIASFGTMILLYIIGFIADIDFLMFKISNTYTEVSLLPIVVGIIIGYISEQIIKYISKK